MKNIYFLFVVITLPLFLVTCAEKNEAPVFNNTGTLTIDGVDYELSQGIIDYDGIHEPGEGHNFSVDLVSPDFDLSNLEFPQGIGEYVYLSMYSATGDNLAIGTYDYNEEHFSGSFGGAILMGFNASSEEVTGWYDISAGNTIVTLDNNIYEFTASFVADEIDLSNWEVKESGIIISVYYKGTLIRKNF